MEKIVSMRPTRLSARLAMTLLLCVLTAAKAGAKVGDVLASGTCGENVTWTLTENGERYYKTASTGAVKGFNGVTLTISGTGEITNRDYYQSEGATGLFGSGAARADNFISTIIIEEGVTSIPNQAFWQFYNLHHISLPSTLTTIGYGAFYNCDELKSIVIPDGVSEIQRQTFYSCDSLRSVTLGKGVKTIEQRAFRDCARLMTLRVKRYEPTDESNPITSFQRATDPFLGCVSLASLVLPEAGKTRYLEYDELNGNTYATEWDYTRFRDADGKSTIFFRDLIRTDRDTLFYAGTTNEWTEWTDKFNHAAPRGVEVYTIGSIEGRTVRLNKLTATVTLPEDERDGDGDDGVRPLVPAFTPVLIKRPSGTLTEDLKMQFVMGGELTPENGWYCSHSGNPSLWGRSGVYDNEAVSRDYVPAPVPDIMASVPYGYKELGYTIWVEGATPSGRGDYLYGLIQEGFYWANVDKTSKRRCEYEVFNDDRYSYFKLEDDQFRFFPQAEDGIAPHHGTLRVTAGYLGGDLTSPLALSINERTEVTLANYGTDNTDAIAAAASTTNNRVTLSGRAFYLDGDWNTLCLPFDENFYSPTSKAPDLFINFYVNDSQDAIVMELDTEGTYDGHQTGIDAEDGALHLYFKRAYAIEAGKPYLVKWNNRFGSFSNPVFYDKAITSTAPTPVIFPGGEFVGTYDCLTFTATDRDILFLGSGNKVHYPKAGATIGAFRAYFQLDKTTPVKAFVLNFGEDNATSLNEELRMKGEELAPAEGWYTLDGRKLQDRPTRRGLYIHNGRKQVLK